MYNPNWKKNETQNSDNFPISSHTVIHSQYQLLVTDNRHYTKHDHCYFYSPSYFNLLNSLSLSLSLEYNIN